MSWSSTIAVGISGCEVQETTKVSAGADTVTLYGLHDSDGADFQAGPHLECKRADTHTAAHSWHALAWQGQLQLAAMGVQHPHNMGVQAAQMSQLICPPATEVLAGMQNAQHSSPCLSMAQCSLGCRQLHRLCMALQDRGCHEVM